MNLFIFDIWVLYNNDDFKLIIEYNDIVKRKYLKKYLFVNKYEYYNFIIVMVLIWWESRYYVMCFIKIKKKKEDVYL